MNTQLLIDSVVQQTVVFIAQLATSGGVRAPLAHVANEVFLGLTRELVNQGVKKKVIADMFGVALRTYHRRVRELGRSRTDVGQTLWEAVVNHVRDHEPVTGAEIQRRFRHDDPEVLTGILNDLVSSGLVYRAGRTDTAVYRIADEADFAQAGTSRDDANRYLVWHCIYRQGPVALPAVVEETRLSAATCQAAVEELIELGWVRRGNPTHPDLLSSDRFEVPLGTTQGWEVAVLDHFQAMVTAISRKLARGSARSGQREEVGGSTWSLDVWQGHPLEGEAVDTLSRVRSMMEDLRRRIDDYNSNHSRPELIRRVVFYLGQYVDSDVHHVDERDE